MKIVYVNYGCINEYGRNPRINEHCLSISENKVQIPYQPEFFSRPYFPQLLLKWCSLLRGNPYLFLYPQFTFITFIYLQSFIHQFTGLFGSNIMIGSQLACQLSWQSAAPVSQRSWVPIPYRPQFFHDSFSLLLKIEMFITARIASMLIVQTVFMAL